MTTKRDFHREPKEVKAEAEALIRALGGRWTYEHASNNGWYFDIIDGKNRRIFINLNDAPKRYEASVSWPRFQNDYQVPKGVERYSAGCDFQRGPEALANAIKKKLVPLLDQYWDESVKMVEHYKAQKDQVKATVVKLNALFGQTPSPQWEHTIYGRNGIDNINVNHDGTQASIMTDTLPLPLVEAIVKMVVDFHRLNKR